MSLSKCHRLEGNHILSGVSDDLAPVVWKGRINSALAKYQTAFQAALTPDEKGSAAKNYAVVSRKLANFYHGGRVTQNTKLTVYYFRESVMYYHKAYKEGFREKSLAWLTDIQSKLSIVIQEVYEYAKSEDLGHGRVIILEKILEVMEDAHHRGECYIEIGLIYFKEAVTAIEKKNFRDSLYCLKECYRPVEEAKLCGDRTKNEYVLTEVRVLECDVFLQTCIAEALQARSIGDDMLAKVLRDYEELPIPLIWEVMDWYRKSNLLAQEQDIEIEAVAYARIGKVYHRVLSLTTMGKKSYMKSLDLAASLHPRTFNAEEWYQECAEGLSAIQRESVLEEEKRKDKARKKTIIQLNEELKELDNNTYDSKILLKYVYKKFPPKNPKHVLAADFENNMKKTLCLAIQHYHPDKIDASQHGQKWKVLCEEITKRLTNKYEYMKGV